MLAVVCLNLAVMACAFYQMPVWLENLSQIVNLVTVMAFLLEFAWKAIALRANYFTSLWNLFDFAILIFSLIGSLFILLIRCFADLNYIL